MTMIRYFRCQHCGERYKHALSGPPVREDRSTDKHCEGCAEAQRKALKAVPRLFEGRWRPTSESPGFEGVTLDHVLAWEKTRMTTSGPAFARRVFVGLYDLTNGDHQEVRGVVGLGTRPDGVFGPRQPGDEYQGVLFKLGTWMKRPEYELEVEWEWDLQKGAWTAQRWR
jgi:hypothetical protein